LHNLTYWY